MAISLWGKWSPPEIDVKELAVTSKDIQNNIRDKAQQMSKLGVPVVFYDSSKVNTKPMTAALNLLADCISCLEELREWVKTHELPEDMNGCAVDVISDALNISSVFDNNTSKKSPAALSIAVEDVLSVLKSKYGKAFRRIVMDRNQGIVVYYDSNET